MKPPVSIPVRPSRTPATPGSGEPSRAAAFDDLIVAMNARGLTACELAKRAGLPVGHVEQLATGTRRLGVAAARRLAPHLGDVAPAVWIRKARAHERGIVGVN